MSASKIILKNTLLTYVRMVFSAVATLFSARWVLQTLGSIDYGIFSLVGSIIGVMAFLNAVMSGATARNLAFSVGTGDITETRKWFTSSLYVHVGISTAFGVAAFCIGELVIRRILNIPTTRVATALWVFRLSLLASAFSMCCVPFSAMFTAHQKIGINTLLVMMQTLLNFGIAWWIRIVPGDKLFIYVLAIVCVNVLLQIGLTLAAILIFPASSLRKMEKFDTAKARATFQFTGWSLIGGTGVILRDHGIAILLNVLYGPAINAAYGIANQVSGQTKQLSEAMMGAVAPEITARAGRCEKTRMLNLASWSSRIGTLLIMYFSIPLLIETPYILKLWLKAPPAYASDFCRWIIITSIIDSLSTGFSMAVSANGKIAGYQITIGGIMVSTVIFAALFLHLGFSPSLVGMIFACTMTLCTIGRAWWAQKIFRTSIRIWLREVVLPLAVVAGLATLAGTIPLYLNQEGIVRLMFSTALCAVTISISAWVILLNSSEKVKIFVGFASRLNILFRKNCQDE